MTTPLPRNIAEYREQLRAALRGADPALVQDALYDAEDHLRSELAENPGKSEAEVLAKIAATYGAPDEVLQLREIDQPLLPAAIAAVGEQPRNQIVTIGDRRKERSDVAALSIRRRDRVVEPHSRR